MTDQVIIRELWVCDSIAATYIRDELDFPSIRQVGFIRKRIYDRGVLTRQEDHYGATSLSLEELPPDKFLGTTRNHWEVENGLHHVKDRSWGEDHQYSNSREKGGILGTLRNLSLNAMRIIQPPEPDRNRRKHQKSLPMQAIGYIVNPVRALMKLAGI